MLLCVQKRCFHDANWAYQPRLRVNTSARAAIQQRSFVKIPKHNRLGLVANCSRINSRTNGSREQQCCFRGELANTSSPTVRELIRKQLSQARGNNGLEWSIVAVCMQHVVGNAPHCNASFALSKGRSIGEGGHGILELDNFRANLELYIYRIYIFFGNNTFFWENEALHIKNNSTLKHKSKNG